MNDICFKRKDHNSITKCLKSLDWHLIYTVLYAN